MVYCQYMIAEMESEQGDRHLHEQTGLSAGTVTDNDQLATDLSHLRGGSMGVLWELG